MKHETITWKSKDEQEIYGQYWQSTESEKAVIALVHGFGEHSGRYDHVAAAFTGSGYSVIAFDHRGHGKSGGQRGHTPAYECLMQDIDVFLDKARDIFPDTNIILYGHSMGGNIVINYLIRRKPELTGAIATGPLFRTTDPPPAFQVALGKVMNKIWGAFPDRAKLDASFISRDKEVVDRYVNDPMVHNRISARMGLSLISSGEFAIEHASEVTVPLYILHGEEDKLTDCAASREFKANAGDNVRLDVLPGLYHEVHNEPEKEEILNRIINWCDQLTHQ